MKNAYDLPHNLECPHRRVNRRHRVSSRDQVIAGYPDDSMRCQLSSSTVQDNLPRLHSVKVTALHSDHIPGPYGWQHTGPGYFEANFAGAPSHVGHQLTARSTM